MKHKDQRQGVSPEGANIGNPQGGAVRCCRVRPPENVLARTRVPYYSPCFLPSILHLLVYWTIIQVLTGEGKGVAAFTREWGLFSRVSSYYALMMRDLSAGVKAVKAKCRDIV